MNLCLDSSTVIDLLRDRMPDTRRHMQAALDAGSTLWMSPMVVQEVAAGALLSRRPEHHLNQLDVFLRRTRIAELTADDGFSAGRLRADFQKACRKIGALDVLIAGQAVARGWTIVTGNPRCFLFIHGLSVINWSVSDQPLDQAAMVASLHRPPPKD